MGVDLRGMRGRARARRRSSLAIGVVLAAALLASCTTTGGGGGSPGVSRFCQLWDEVAAAEPTLDNPVLVKDNVVAGAEDTSRTGSNCNAANAKVVMEDALVAEGGLVESEQGTNAPMEVAVTGDTLTTGEAVFENLIINGVTLEIGLQGITLRGTVSITLSGQTSIFNFAGTLQNLDSWSITISSPQLYIPGLTVAPISFTGFLNSVGGVRTLMFHADVPEVRTGDIRVTNAHVHFDASDTTGLHAVVEGTVDVGPSSAAGVVDVNFDTMGTLLSAKVDVAAHLEGTDPDGHPVVLDGALKLEGNPSHTTAAFSATGHIGDLVINEAAGELEITPTRATFEGVVDAVQGANSVRFDASIVFEAGAALPELALPNLGLPSGTTSDGQTVTLNGSLQIIAEPGGSYTRVTGDIHIGPTHAQGVIDIRTVGQTSTMTVNASVVDAGYNATLNGTIVVTAGTATNIDLTANLGGTLVMGDLSVSNGNLRIRSTGGPITLTVGGTIRSGASATLNGNLTAVVGPDGQLLSLGGTANGTLLLETWGVATFQGTVNATSTTVTITGSGKISGVNFPVAITFNGSFTSSLTQPDWTLQGSGRLLLGPIDVASARLKLSKSAGMEATRVGFYFRILFIPTYFEADIYLNPSGGCERLDVVGGNIIGRVALAIALPPLLPGCDVNV